MIRIICSDGDVLEGWPIYVEYADESDSGEDELDLEIRPGHIIGLRESEISHIEIIKE